MKLRFRVGSKEASKEARKNGDIEALADAMRALKKIYVEFGPHGAVKGHGQNTNYEKMRCSFFL